MSHTKPPEKEYKPPCYKCGERKLSVKKCGNMWWCAPCRKVLVTMTTDKDAAGRYIPDDEKPPRKILVNNVDWVEPKE